MKRIVACLLSICMLLTGCNSGKSAQEKILPPSEAVVAAETLVTTDFVKETEATAFVEPTAQEPQPETDITETSMAGNDSEEQTTATEKKAFVEYTFKEEPAPDIKELDDENLQRYMEDTVYSDLISKLPDGFAVENVSTTYISKEYIEELSYNSMENVFFGYTLSELNDQFQGKKYMFTLGDDGQTIVTEVEGFDDTYEKVLKNVAIGSGVILVCVTVSAVTGGLGAPAASMIFAVSAKTGAVAALSGGVISGVAAGTVEGIKTQDFNKAVKAAALSGSEGFKWGAIGGAISGGAGEAIALKGATLNGLTMNDVAIIQKESKYPLDIVKQFHTMDEYEVFKSAGLKPRVVNAKTALVRTDIDINKVDDFGRTNLQRMKQGLAPLDSSGKSYQLHHIGQRNDATLAILTEAEHDSPALHGFINQSEIVRDVFDKTREKFWKSMAELLVEV